MSDDKLSFFNKLSALGRIFVNAPRVTIDKEKTHAQFTFTCTMKSGDVFIGRGSSASIAEENAYEQACNAILSRISSVDVHDVVADVITRNEGDLMQSETSSTALTHSPTIHAGDEDIPIFDWNKDNVNGSSVSAINDYCQKNKIPLPVYAISSHGGKPHAPAFKGTASCSGEAVTCVAYGSKQFLKCILANMLLPKIAAKE